MFGGTCTSLPGEKAGYGKGFAILLNNDAPVSPESPFFAYLYLIAEQIPSITTFIK